MLSNDRAETIGLQLLGFIASDMELLGRFLALTGIGPHQLKAQASDPAFLGAVIDFVMNHETTMKTAMEQTQLSAQEIRQARAVLPGQMPLD